VSRAAQALGPTWRDRHREGAHPITTTEPTGGGDIRIRKTKASRERYFQDAERSIGCLLGQFVGAGVDVSHETRVVDQLTLRPQARARLVGLTHCMEEEEERGERGRGEEAERERELWASFYP
jgi:hypothetical protein